VTIGLNFSGFCTLRIVVILPVTALNERVCYPICCRFLNSLAPAWRSFRLPEAAQRLAIRWVSLPSPLSPRILEMPRTVCCRQQASGNCLKRNSARMSARRPRRQAEKRRPYCPLWFWQEQNN